LFADARQPERQTANENVAAAQPNINPLEFQRLAVRRFFFSDNIKISKFVLSEIVAFEPGVNPCIPRSPF
jgi:hypothetical protein